MSCVGPILYHGKCVRGNDVRVIDCASCGYAHLHPKPSEAALEKYYQETYYGGDKPDYKAEIDRVADYQEVVYAAQARYLPTGLMDNESMWHLPVLEVGCGHDAPFLHYMAENRLPRSDAPTLYGLDPGVVPYRFNSAGFNFKIVRKWDYLGMIPFAWIALPFVLEHIHDPVEVLYRCRSHLATGGKLLLEVPFDFNPLQLSMRPEDDPAWWVSSPDHLNYFTPRSMEGLLCRAGLRMVHCESTYPVELFIAQGQDYREDQAAKNLLVEKRAYLQVLWADLGWGRPNVFSLSPYPLAGRTFWMVAEAG